MSARKRSNVSVAALKASICTLVALVFSLPAFAQIQNGRITGVISDPSGAAIAHARVHVSNVATGYEADFESNGSGIYTVPEISVGSYTIRVEITGFKTITAANLNLNAGTVLRVDLKLAVGGRFEMVEVSNAARLINTEDSRLSYTIYPQQISNLPLNGRNVYDLIQYMPGATNTRGIIFENGANTVVNGVRQNFNGFRINGISNTGLSGGPVSQPILDTVQEVQILALNNAAEFGGSAGAITNLVTKSGTNEFHGSAWEYIRNDIFDANSFFANHLGQKKLPLRLNQFGATVGGPVKRDRLFFFASYQGERFLTSSPGPAQVESAEFRSATVSAFPNSVAALLYSNFPPAGKGTPFISLKDYVANQFSGTGFSSFADYLCPANTDGGTRTPGAISRKFAALFGVEQGDIDAMNANCPGGSPYAAPSSGSFKRDANFLESVLDPNKSQADGNLFDGNEASLRLDYNANPNSRFFSQFNWARAADKYSSENGLRGFTSPSTLTTPNFQLSFIRTFSPTLLNELQVGYLQNRSVTSIPLAGVPSVTFDDGTVGFSAAKGLPQSSREGIYSFSELLSWTHGTHDLKAGVEVGRNSESSEVDAGRPTYSFFDSLFFAIDAPHFEDAGVDPGFATGDAAHLATNIRHWRNWNTGAYLRDDWKLSKRFTLNLGLRYDLYTRSKELNHLATTFMKGPGRDFIDNITTGAGQIKDASAPCPGDPKAVLAGECGPGGFTATKTLGKGDHNNVGPRIGFAWDVFGNGRTSLRGGFGISYEANLQRRFSLTRWNPPYYSLNQISNFLTGATNSNVVYGPVGGGSPTFRGPAPSAQHSGTGAQATGNISGWDPANPQKSGYTSILLPEGVRDPYVENWFFGMQRQLGQNFIAELNYVGTAGRKLFRAESVNRIAGGLLPEGTCVTGTFKRQLCSQINTDKAANGMEINPLGSLNPNYGRLRVWENSANSIYHALQFSVRTQISRGWHFSGNYTYSHSIDSDSTWQSSGTTVNGPSAGDAFTTDQTQPRLDRGNSVFDIRHRVAFNYVWEMPFFLNGHGWAATVLRGWQWNGIWSIQSGAHWSAFDLRPSSLQGNCVAPLTSNCVNTGGDYNLDGEPNDRPNAMANNVHATHSQWADGFNLPRNFFSAPCLGCVGNLGRNTFVGPGYWAADVSLFKSFMISERLRFQFRLEAFNVLNHTNFLIGSNVRNDPLFGRAGGTAPSRNLQLGLNLTF